MGLHRFKEFLLNKDLKVDEDDLFYRFSKFRDSEKAVKKLQKRVDFMLELNEFSYLNEKERRQKLGYGIDGDLSEYEHLLRQLTDHPEKMEKFMKNTIQMKMKILKNDKKIRESRNCVTNEFGYKTCDYSTTNNNKNESINPFQKDTVFHSLYEMGGDDMLDVDWEKAGYISNHIIDQGACGSCWAFAITGSIESSYLIEKGKRYNLSEQELVLNNKLKCNGGLMYEGIEYVKENGILEEYQLPYEINNYLESATIPNIKKDKKVQILDYVGIKDGNMLSFLSHLAYRPVTAVVNINDTFYYYKSGIMNMYLDNMSRIGSIGVLAVGYHIDKEDPNNSYIRYRISWGNQWGEQGYFRVHLENHHINHAYSYSNFYLHMYSSFYTVVSQ